MVKDSIESTGVRKIGYRVKKWERVKKYARGGKIWGPIGIIKGSWGSRCGYIGIVLRNSQMVVSIIGGAQYRPPITIILVVGATKMVPWFKDSPKYP